MITTCPSCGGPVEDTGDRCTRCGQSTARRYIGPGNVPRKESEAASPLPLPELVLPCLVPGARFVAGEIWTHGSLRLAESGVFLLSEPDGPWTPEKLAALDTHDPSQPHPVGASSFYLPLGQIERFQHSRITSFAIIARDGKRPLRLEPDGWRMIDAYSAKTGIPSR